MEQHLREFERALLRRNFRPNSIKAYVRSARRFLAEADTPLSGLTREHITVHLDRLTAGGAAAQTRNQVLAAIRLFMTEVAGAPQATAGLRRAMVPPTVPVVLSGTEVQGLLEACRTPSHRALLMALYASGLRVTEACCLRIDDVDSKRMVLRVVDGKTGDRYAPLSPTLLEALRAHYRFARPPGPFLFPGRPKSKPVTRGATRHVLIRAARDAGITKKVTPHSLRHSFAIHMLELGSDLRSVQLALGHRRITSTVGYLHMSQQRLGKIPSPMEQLGTSQAAKLG